MIYHQPNTVATISKADIDAIIGSPFVLINGISVVYTSKNEGDVLRLDREANASYLEITHTDTDINVSLGAFTSFRTEVRYPRHFPTTNATYNYPDGTQVRIIASLFLSGHTPLMAFNNVYSEFGWATPDNPHAYTLATGLAKNINLTTGSNYAGEWIMIDLGEVIQLTRYKFIPRLTLVERLPKIYRWYGSNDDNAYNNVNHASWVKINERHSNPPQVTQVRTSGSGGSLFLYCRVVKASGVNIYNSNSIMIRL